MGAAAVGYDCWPGIAGSAGMWLGRENALQEADRAETFRSRPRPQDLQVSRTIFLIDDLGHRENRLRGFIK